MKIFNLYLKIIFIYFLTLTSCLNAAFENKIIANINNQIISSFEFENKIRTILFLSGQEMSQKNINGTKMAALNNLINYKIKKGELLSYKIPLSNEKKASDYLNNVSSKYNTNIQGLKRIFEINKLDFEFYLEEVNVEIAWQQLIYDLYKNKIVHDEEEVNKQINKLIETQKDVDNYNLSEIEISSENVQDNLSRIKEIENEIKKNGFENTAVKFSVSETAFSDGNLGWISSEVMSKKILDIVSKMKIGQISKPIIQTNSILFLKLIDKNSINTKNINLDEMRNKVIYAKRNELLNLYSNNHLSKIKNNALIKIHE